MRSPRDEILDNATIYRLTASAASSARLHWESFRLSGDDEFVTLPTGVAAFPKEILPSPRSWFVIDVREFFDMVR